MSFDGDTGGNDPSFPDFVDALNDVDESDPSTARNETSIDDNNGGRIELDEGGSQEGTIHGVEEK